MLSVDHVFCERLYLCEFNRRFMHSREVVLNHLIELHYVTELLIECGTSGIPRKFKAERKISCPCAPKMPSVTGQKK